MADAQPVALSARAAATAVTSYRWRICALLFFATTINYVDRQVLGVLAPELQRAIGWSEIQYSNIVNAFQGAYAIGLLLAGRFIDRAGTRAGYAAATGRWSLATMGHALVRAVAGFGIARFFLGLGESGNFPAAIKTVAEWFPKNERALATGIFNSGTRFFQHGWSVNRARKTAMLICALAVLPIVFVAKASDLRVAGALIGLAAAAHQGWSANLLTLASDLFPQPAVASVTGIGGFGGAIGGMCISTFTGFVLQITHSYVPVFLVAGSVYLTALLVIHALVPRLEPAAIEL